jgi:outer membrane receptor protein involved in Fe transport
MEPAPQPPGVTPPPGGGGIFDIGFSSGAVGVERGTGPSPAGGASVTVGGGQTQPRAASDVGDLLGKAQESTGVELQRRTPITSDPRIRGYHVGQVSTWSDGGFFFPARQDLDTAISKYDASQISDVLVIKGPYSAHHGPGFAFLDIATLDSPRYQCGTEMHGRTSFGYQTNGMRLDAMQALWGGSEDWGFRVSYGIRVGNDYLAGAPYFTVGEYHVPSSYNSQPINFAVGFNLSPDSKIEVKGMRLDQRAVEFPGTYFDINRLGTDAESVRYIVEHQEYFDRFAVDAWWNRTAANGDTHQGAKQGFLGTFLTDSFMAQTPEGQLIGIVDRSNTNFSEISRGFRAATTWGERGHIQLSLGSDLNYVNQQLVENIDWQSQDGPVPQFFGQTTATQTLGIPRSNLLDGGVFAELAVPVTPRFDIKSGARGDWVETRSQARLVSGTVPIGFKPPNIPVFQFDPIVFSAQPFNNELQNHYQLWSAYIASEYKIDEHLTAIAQFGYAQRPPTLTELYAAGPFIAVLQQGLNRTFGDPHLAPEKLNQMDLGLRADYGWFRGGINGFYAWIHDYITYDLNTHGAFGSPISQVVFTNTDRATLAGGELYGEFDLMDWLTSFGNLTYTEGRDLTHIDNRRALELASSRRTGDNEPLPSIPPLEGRVGIRIHQPSRSPRWAVECAVRIVREQDLVATSLGEQPTAGFSVWDLRSFWRVTDAWTLTAGVENLFNKFYREHLDPLAGYPTDLLFRPGTNIYVGAQVQY